jgi:hypothetical protein
MGLFTNLLNSVFKASSITLTPAPASSLVSTALPGRDSMGVLGTVGAYIEHTDVHLGAHIANAEELHLAVADDDRASLEAWWTEHAGDTSHPVDINSHEVQAILAMDKADMEAFGGPFLAAWKHAMKWESGREIDLADPEIILGLVYTHAQQVKSGYTDGVTGASVNDKGGETKDGWAAKAHPGDNIKKMRLITVLRGYKAGYWNAVKGDQLSPKVACIVFDVGCGSGPRKGITMLQQACGVVVDGALGPATLAAANAMDPSVLTEKIHQLRLSYYRAIGVGGNAGFLNGWLNRANDVLQIK